MSLLNIPIPNLLNGVSQQPPNLRFPTQADLQENAYSSIVEGLGKRPPTEHVAKLAAATNGQTNFKVHAIDRGDQIERYIVVLNGSNHDSTIQVFGVDGTSYSVYYDDPTTKAYLQCANPNTQLKLISVADFTFIVNTTVTVQMDNAVTASRPYEALVWVKQGAEKTKYSIEGTNDAVFTTDTGTVPTPAVDGESFTGGHSDAAWIAANLKGGSGNILTTSAPWTVERVGYSIYISHANTDFNISVSDGLGGNGLGLIKDEVQTFADLPSVAKDGMIVNIAGLPESDADNYWLEFSSNNGTNIGEGIWSETVAPGVKYKYNYDTMPVVLIRQSDNTFMCKRANGLTPSGTGPGYPAGRDYSAIKWTSRICGDDSTNPQPSFVGQKINDIFLHRGRLGFLASESVILSEVGEFFNFWRTTITQLLDSDPIDVSSSYPSITLFRHAIPFSDRLVLFSDRVQFILGTRQNILTATNVGLTPTANYDALRTCRPVVVNDGIFFPFDRGNYSGVRQMTVNLNDSEILTAPDVTNHIPKYIPGGIFELAASSHDNVLACLSSGEQTSLFIYKWYDSGNERIQSSWSKWTFNGATIRGLTWMQASLYVVLERVNAYNQTTERYLEKITIEPNRKDTYSKFITTLDRRADAASASYNAALNRTTFTLRYTAATGATMMIALKATVSTEAGYQLQILQTTHTASNTTLVVEGQYTASSVWIGEQYTMKYRFSKPYLKQDSSAGRSMSLSAGRFQIRAVQLIYDNSSTFRVITTNDFNGTQYTYVWAGNILGTGQAIIGDVPVESGTYRFPVYGKNDEITIEIQNPTPVPSNFLSAEIEATYDARSRRI
jgi:hypothetical protein